MTSNFYMYDHFARPLTTIDAASTPRSWLLNDIGSVQFEYGITSGKFTENNFQHGNLIRIEHVPSPFRGRLQDWVGVLIGRRLWNVGVCSLSAVSAEAILQLRPMPWVKVDGTPGTIFLKILTYAAQTAGVIIQPGVVEDTNLILADDLRGSAYDHIISLVKRSGMSWDVTCHVAPSGNLELFANLRAKSGQDTGKPLDNLNSELHSPILVEEGIPHNVVVGHTWASTERARFHREAVNQDALMDYGYMGINKTYMGVHDIAGLLAAAQVEANTFGRPLLLMDRTILNEGYTFTYLRPGNLLDIDDHTAGFLPGGGIGIKGKGRILRMEYNDLTDKVTMKMEIIRS